MTKIRDTTEPLPVTQIVTKAKEIGKVTKEQQKTNDQFGFFCLFVCFRAQPQFIDYTQTFFGRFRSVKDLHPGWCLFDRVRTLPTPELICYSVTAEEAQTKT